MASIDVTVMGAGIFGLSIAYVCAARGARVRVIDRAGVGAGSSGGIVGALAPHVPENWNPKKAFQLESLLMAAEFWARVDAASGLPSGYARLGRLQPVQDARGLDLARAREAQAKTLWRGRAEWRVVAAPGGDWSPGSGAGFVIHDTLSARLYPRLACDSLAGAVRALGGEVVMGEAAPKGLIVWATGVDGLRALSASVGRDVGGGVKGQALLLGHDVRDAPQLFVDGLHFVPHRDGTVAVGSTSERAYDVPGATDAALDAVHARAVAAVPVLAGAPVVGRWAGVRPRARTRSPMLGEWPGRPGQFVANGGFKIGFGMAPKVAEVMADLVLEGRDAVPEGFRVEDNL